MRQPSRRFPRSVFGVGDEPDPRFSLANERTFLSWIRSALAFLAGGVALETLAPQLHPLARGAASALLMLTGLIAALQAWRGWARTEKALRMGLPLPSTLLSALIAGVTAVVAILVFGALVFGRAP